MMANKQIEKLQEKSYAQCHKLATEWRVSASHCDGSVSNYNKGDHVMVTNVMDSDGTLYCAKVLPNLENRKLLGHGIVLHVDVLMLVVCWKPSDNE